MIFPPPLSPEQQRCVDYLMQQPDRLLLLMDATGWTLDQATHQMRWWNRNQN